MYKSKNNRTVLNRSISIAIVGLIVTVVFITWLALDRTDRHIKNNFADSLIAVNTSVKQSINTWADNRASEARHIIKNDEVLPMIEALLALSRDHDSLVNSSELKAIRAFYHRQNRHIGALGFFVIAPDGTSLASSRDENIGSINWLVKQQPELMKRAFSGENLFIPMVISDVALKDKSGRFVQKAPTLFFTALMRNNFGEIIAIFTLRFNPVKALSEISQAGTIGQTGETYVLDKSGRLLTESRFKHQFSITAKDSGSNSTRQVLQARDPGGNFTGGYEPVNDQSVWPLTVMAKSVTTGRTDYNVNGYRDYRGVPVIGAWTWIEEIGVGLATEIDMFEVNDAYNSMRTLILWSLGSISFIALLLMGMVLYRNYTLHQQIAARKQAEARGCCRFVISR